MFCLLYFIGTLTFLTKIGNCQVLELDQSFLDKKQDRAWLVKFYAPWCGHCRKLEPVYNEVSAHLRASSNIIVARVDATQFSSLAQHYDVKGYPTIKFIEGESVFTHHGDRSKESIIQFAKRAKLPHINFVPNVGKMNEFKSEHSAGVFFMFVGSDDPHSELQIEFQNLARQYAVNGYFYQGEKRVLPSNVKPQNEPTVLCFKDGTVYEYRSDVDEAGQENLTKWFNMERYPAFPKISGAGLNEMVSLNKKLIVTVTNEEDKQQSKKNKRLKELTTLMAKKRELYHIDYQFLWMPEPEVMEQITLFSQQTPYVLIFDPSTYHYYLPDSEVPEWTVDTFSQFISNVSDNTATAYGGNGILQRFKRLGFDIKGFVVTLYSDAPWLALLIFGVPTAIISIVCYALCCVDAIDDEDEDPDEDMSRNKEILRERADAGDADAQLLLEKLEEEEAGQNLYDKKRNDDHLKYE